MVDQTHYAGCWQDERHHACALREIERLRQRDETPRCPQCETLRLEAGSMRAEIERIEGALTVSREETMRYRSARDIANIAWEDQLSEVERLRAALEEIRRKPGADNETAYEMRKIAAKALGHE